MSPRLQHVARLYAILDAEALAAHRIDLIHAADVLGRAGVTWVQYRDKVHDDSTVVQNARALSDTLRNPGVLLILNDRVHLFGESGFHGVHLGQTDLTPSQARQMLPANAIVGLSTHSAKQASLAGQNADVDYVAIGPVFATTSKQNPDLPVGTAGVRAARQQTTKPLVAIGGISSATAGDVLCAGADSLAVVGALLGSEGQMEANVRHLLRSIDEQG